MNKTIRLYGIIFIVLLVILALLELNKTQLTDWRKYYDIDKKSPFGLYVFDKEVDNLLSNQVTKAAISPYEYYKGKEKEPHNILIVQSPIDDESWKRILNNVAGGSDAMIISTYTSNFISDTLGLYHTIISYGETSTLKLTDKKFTADSIVLNKLPNRTGFRRIRKSHEILGKEVGEKEYANFIKVKHGKGTIYLHSEPLILTNYYLLESDNSRYVESVFSYLPNRETVWFSRANKQVAESSSPMRFILSNPPLRYAWWVFLGGLLLFVIFNAKRKQRIVPVIEPLENTTVEFVKSIGNLYLQEGNPHDMMAKKAQYFLHHVRTEFLIDTQLLDDKFIRDLHLKTGKSKSKIKDATIFIRKGLNPNARVTEDDLIKMNNLLDEILD
ncbi:MAG TPA: DUF4350 domain-containing protein [Flavobacteriaceae bacterium]|nr:DUF4350 domain-containing protein [Flavobacteriaceae bacterium]